MVRRPSGDEVAIGLVYDKGDVMFASELCKVFQKRGRVHAAGLHASAII